MIAYLLNKVMNWALDKNGRGDYEGEDSKKWAYTITGEDGSPYLSRLLLPRIRIPFTKIEFRPMLHHFHRPDDDGEPHSHPWEWAASMVLAGSYIEERLVGDPRPDRYMTPVGQCQLCAGWRGECQGHPADYDVKHVRFFNFLTKDDYHRVTRLNGPTWTLFVSGPRTPDNAWGFLSADGRHVPWQEFLAERRSRKKRVAEEIFPKKIGTETNSIRVGDSVQIAELAVMLEKWPHEDITKLLWSWGLTGLTRFSNVDFDTAVAIAKHYGREVTYEP